MKKYFNKRTWQRVGLGVGTLGAIIAGSAAFSAFESHIINVTARIENGLLIDTQPIEFGTVFPQEYLTSDVRVAFSDSFADEGRVDDIEYAIKQKPKVKGSFLCDDIEVQAGDDEQMPEGCDPNDDPSPGNPYAHITVGPPFNFTGPAWKFCEENLPPDSDDTDNIPYTVDSTNEYWEYCYLPLANSLSKHENTTDGLLEENDKSVDAFHQAYLWDNASSSLDSAYIATGRLAKSDEDTADSWTIDLKVPCFVDQCAQEADDIDNDVNDHTPGFYVPAAFRLDPDTEHKVFGTDLWIEVTAVSRFSEPIN